MIFKSKHHQRQNEAKIAAKAPFATLTCSSNAICQLWLANHNQNRKTIYWRTLKNKYHSSSLGAAIPLRSAQTELFSTVELQHTTVEHIALVHQFQVTKCRNTCKSTIIAQRQQRREKVTSNPQFHCARSSRQIPRQSGDARNRRAREPTVLRNGPSVYSKKRTVLCKS